MVFEVDRGDFAQSNEQRATTTGQGITEFDVQVTVYRDKFL
jgi:hypothetical protein